MSGICEGSSDLFWGQKRSKVGSLCSPRSASLLVTEEAELTSSPFSQIENKRIEAAWKDKKWDVGKWKLAMNEGS